MCESKTEFEKRIAAKATSLQHLVKDDLSSLQSINALFAFEPNKGAKLTKHGHSILVKVGLLKNDGGNCSECGKSKNLIKKSKGDGLV